MQIPPKSDVGHLRLESPTSDIHENSNRQENLRSVPLRDLARYAGRLVRATAAEGSQLLVTDRGRPLVVISPVEAERPPPRYVWGSDGIVPSGGVEASIEIPPDLPEEQRAVAELLLEEPLSVDGIKRALGWSVGEVSIALVRLEIAGLAYRFGARWHLRSQ